MNAIAKNSITTFNIEEASTIDFAFFKPKVLTIIGIFLISALSVLYVKELNRRLLINSTKLQIELETLQNQTCQLLLERSSFNSQARVQVIANKQLKMIAPTSSDTVIIKL